MGTAGVSRTLAAVLFPFPDIAGAGAPGIPGHKITEGLGTQ